MFGKFLDLLFWLHYFVLTHELNANACAHYEHDAPYEKQQSLQWNHGWIDFIDKWSCFAAEAIVISKKIANFAIRTPWYVVPQRRIDTGCRAVRYIRKALPNALFLGFQNVGNFEITVKNEAIVDSPWVRYVLLTHLMRWVRIITYTYFAGWFYHCLFHSNGFSYDPENGMSKVWLPVFR